MAGSIFKAFKFIKKKLFHRCFPVNFVKFLRAPFFIEYLRWLLLTLYIGSTFPPSACNAYFTKSKFVKKRLQHRCYPVNPAQFLRTAFSSNTSVGCFLDSWQTWHSFPLHKRYLTSALKRGSQYLEKEYLGNVYEKKVQGISSDFFAPKLWLMTV